jgi:phosphoglucomutase
MKELHNHKLEKLLPSKVEEYYDYLSSKMTNSNNEVIKLTLPKSDVLKYVMEDKNSFVIRPSGTEPKIKIYYTVRGNTREECKKSLKSLKNALSSFINEYSKEK